MLPSLSISLPHNQGLPNARGYLATDIARLAVENTCTTTVAYAIADLEHLAQEHLAALRWRHTGNPEPEEQEQIQEIAMRLGRFEGRHET